MPFFFPFGASQRAFASCATREHAEEAVVSWSGVEMNQNLCQTQALL